MWANHEKELRHSGDSFFTGQYDNAETSNRGEWNCSPKTQ
jgi:hypothetical protein